MVVQLNFRNLLVTVIALFFVYLVYALSSARYSAIDGIQVDLKELINYCVLAGYRGGHTVKRIRQEQDLAIKSKGETKEGAKELLTRADLLSNAVMVATLSRYPGLKIVSEEKQSLGEEEIRPYLESSQKLYEGYQSILDDLPKEQVRLSDVNVWIDPLDATQEFTEDLTHFVTVMVCIAVEGKPKFGFIYRPFEDEVVYGLVGHGVYPSGYKAKITHFPTEPESIIVSRSHAGQVEDVAKNAFPNAHVTIEPAGGSGYKSLRVLNGTSTLYLHVTAIKKWDVCAGNAIIDSAGGKMTTLKGVQLDYTEKAGPLNTEGILTTLGNHFTYLTAITKHMPDLNKE